MYKNRIGIFLLIIGLMLACDPSSNSDAVTENNPSNTDQLFSRVTSETSGLSFVNTIQEDETSNYFNYQYFYNGGGVAVGDVDNDGLDDIYFSGNQVKNKLFKNQGDMKFEDVTKSSGTAVGVGWCTGVSMVDINTDGWLDIYVCRAGNSPNPSVRRNLLFINNQDGTFSEAANSYGLGDTGYGTQAYWWDYDLDGDVDCYLVNHRTDFKNNTKINSEIINDIRPESSDQLFRNDDGNFVNVTDAAGIANKNWGLSASIMDFNNDGWPDIYVANDFLEPDALYINQTDGTFTQENLKYLKHISFYGMGSDVGDINNDGLMDLIVLDMVSEDHERSKRNMASMSNDNFWNMVKVGYHYQYMLNTLQLNNGNGSFSEIAQMAGVNNTDWSWAPLFADFDNDGWQDLFVTNGIKRDVTDNDFRINVQEMQAQQASLNINEVLDLMPSIKLANYLFKNNGDLTFDRVNDQWGITDKMNSNGCAYADFDKDGDLDLIVNNVDEEVALYKNNSAAGAAISVSLNGPAGNPDGLGTRVEIDLGNRTLVRNHHISRGFHSGMSGDLVVGVGDEPVTAVRAIWYDGSITEVSSPDENKRYVMNYNAASPVSDKEVNSPWVKALNPESLGINYLHRENQFDDFIAEILLPHRHSQHGPFIAKGDINGDGLMDIHIGGAAGSSGSVFIQNGKGGFERLNQPAFEVDKNYEDLSNLFLDADNDGDQDLIVVSGGNDFGNIPNAYQDRLYINDGNGQFSKAGLPQMPGSALDVAAADIDGDGDLDIFLGGRVSPAAYPTAPDSYLLRNDGGRFTDITPDALRNIGMITDAEFADMDADGDPDLAITGEWMGVAFFENNGGSLSLRASNIDYSGWNFSLTVMDVNQDGMNDLLVGNLGLNNKFHPGADHPMHVYYNDFDDNGTYDIVLSKDKKGTLLPVRGRECSSEQMPFIKDKFEDYESFATATLEDIYGDKLDNALHLTVDNFAHHLFVQKAPWSFESQVLPNTAQRSPILKSALVDLNGDGRDEILSAGNFHMAEVETIRYDAGIGSVLYWQDEQFSDVPANKTGLYLDGDVKDFEFIDMADGRVLLIATRNNGTLKIFECLMKEAAI